MRPIFSTKSGLMIGAISISISIMAAKLGKAGVASTLRQEQAPLPRRFGRKASHFLAFSISGVLTGCSSLKVLDPAGPVASGDRAILLNSTGVMLAIVIPTIAACVAFSWWFRASNERATRRPNFVYSGRIELLVWSIPVLAIIFLGGIIWVGSHRLDPGQSPSTQQPLEVQVVSMDWKWLFIYPSQGIATVNTLVIPAGRPIKFSLTSSTVMNSFFIPRLGGMIATMAGMVTHLNVIADAPATFTGRSTQFSGEGFADMHFSVDARTPEVFQSWVESKHGNGGKLDLVTFEQLEKPSTIGAPIYFGDVDPGLFRHAIDSDRH